MKLSKFHVLPKVNKSKKIIGEINESNNICVNILPPEDLRERPIEGDQNLIFQRKC